MNIVNKLKEFLKVVLYLYSNIYDEYYQKDEKPENLKWPQKRKTTALKLNTDKIRHSLL